MQTKHTKTAHQPAFIVRARPIPRAWSMDCFVFGTPPEPLFPPRFSSNLPKLLKNKGLEKASLRGRYKSRRLLCLEKSPRPEAGAFFQAKNQSGPQFPNSGFTFECYGTEPPDFATGTPAGGTRPVRRFGRVLLSVFRKSRSDALLCSRGIIPRIDA